MAPIRSDDESSVIGSSASGSAVRGRIAAANCTALLDDGEEEFHTEDSEGSDGGIDVEEDGVAEEDDDEDDESAIDDDAANAPSIPLLPENLLKHVPQTVPPLQNVADVPWAQLTRKQKKSRRKNNRDLKRMEYERQGGVVGAAKKRTVVPVKKEKVKGGRVEKKGRAKVQLSGKQQVIEERKRTAQKGAGETGGTAKNARSSR